MSTGLGDNLAQLWVLRQRRRRNAARARSRKNTMGPSTAPIIVEVCCGPPDLNLIKRCHATARGCGTHGDEDVVA